MQKWSWIIFPYFIVEIKFHEDFIYFFQKELDLCILIQIKQ